ncbi:MAG TPA: hypothetical protein VMV29_17720 [Ktedonobacterales bacterium]|nr:hypothetical protein [Ktedonobacterales bacterium]
MSLQRLIPSPTTGSLAVPSPRRFWWLRLASSSGRNPQHTLHERALARRSDFIAWLALGLLGAVVIISPIAIGDVHALLVYIGFVLGLVGVIALNRIGRVYLAGALLVTFISAAILAYMVSSPLGLTLGQLPNYDMLAVGVVVAATVLPRWAAFVVAALNSVAIIVDYLVQPHNLNLIVDADLYPSPLVQTLSLVSRPIAFEFLLAVVAYLWARGMERAIERAEQSDEIAALKQRELENARALQEGARYLHQTLNQWAQGNLRPRVPAMPEESLQQVGDDLNQFIGRFSTYLQADFQLRRADAEMQRLAEALHSYAQGRPTVWPAPTGTPVDQVIEALRPLIPDASGRPRDDHWPG